jgi:hypothetical protein
MAKVPVWLNTNGFRQLIAVVLMAFVGTMGQHLMGGLLYELTLGVIGSVPPLTFRNTIWFGIFFIYPAERLLITALSTVIAVGILTSTRNWLGRIPSRGGST